MANQLTQAELIDLAKQAGFKETIWSGILGVKVESLAKFAQLIQPVGPTSQESRQVEQGGDELVEALEAAEIALANAHSHAKEYKRSPDNEHAQMAGALVKVRQALANRRGGE